MLIYTTHDGGAAVALYAPASAVLPGGAGTLDVQTDYPFDDTVTVVVNNSGAKPMPLYLRVPTWATGATVDGQPAANGTMAKVQCPVGSSTHTLELHPEIRLERWTRTDATGTSNATSYSVHRGALMYSLPLGTNFTMYAHHFGTPDMSSDYFVTATTPWNYALVVDDPADPAASLSFARAGYKPGSAPFNHSGWPTSIRAKARRLPGWVTAQNSAAPPPDSPACASPGAGCGEPEEVQLVPHGGTDLRMGELPLA